METRVVTFDMNGANITYDSIRRFRRDLQLQFYPADGGGFAMTADRARRSIEPLYNEVKALSIEGFLTGGNTLAGFPVVELDDIPADEIHFRGTDGRLLGKIVHLG